MDSLEHHLREIEQIQLIQKKLIARLETEQESDKQNIISEMLDNLNGLHGFTERLTGVLATRTINQSLLTKLNHELRTPLVPISAYTKMLLSEKFGKLSEEQMQRLRIVDNSIEQLKKTIEDLLDQRKSDVIRSNNENTDETNHKIIELKQEKMILNKMVQNEEKKYLQLSRKHVFTIAGSIAVICIVIAVYSLFVAQLEGQQYRVSNAGTPNDGYVVQNLQGETINTWLSWRLVSGTVLNVNVIDADKYPGKLDLIKDVILSQKSIDIDDSLVNIGPKGTSSTYYIGWEGALAEASDDKTQFYIPTKFNVIESSNGEGDITINLTDEQSGDGYSGYTKSIADPTQHQILKSQITIYEASKLSDNQFKTILRHEFGHALGLAHSTDSGDLMHATIQTEYPYISSCDINAIQSLYSGSEKSQVICGNQ